MSIDAIHFFLREAIGLDGNTIGRKTVERVIQQRMRASGYTDIESYLASLKENGEELQLLIDDITVPETWFFRDGKPFTMLAEYINKEWLAKNRAGLLRILSIPCATGEEPYSIAMVLRDLGINESTLRVDAVDVSLRTLERAKRAIYGENSFRGDEGNFRDRYFTMSGKSYRLNDSIRKMVNFIHANLLDDKFMPGNGIYDVIFCRNVLIYFDREIQQLAIEKLHRLLSPNGILVVGHAEGSRLQEYLFSSVRIAGAYAFVKCKENFAGEIKDKSGLNNQNRMSWGKEATSATTAAKGRLSAAAREDSEGKRKKKAGKSVAPDPAQKKDNLENVIQHEEAESAVDRQIENAFDKEKMAELQEVKRLADNGELERAAARCERYLNRYATSADGYYLLGLIREASGNEQAAGDLFRKAVYLEPSHYHALVHLAAFSEFHGDVDAANAYRQRALRAAGTKK